MTQLADYSSLDISQSAIELEESILGAILLDPKVIAAVEHLPIEAFSISAHQQIFRVMRSLHEKNVLPDTLAVAFSLEESGNLDSVGGRTKLASLLDRTVHSFLIKQHADLLLKKYYQRTLSDRLYSIARLAQTEPNIALSVAQIQSELEKIQTVTGDTSIHSDSSISGGTSFSTTVTDVTKILEQGLPQWQEIALLDVVRSQLRLSKESFAALVTSLRCQSDEITPTDRSVLERLIDWKNTKLDFHQVLPHIASDLLHDAQVLNIDPLMLWQYLLPAVLSLVGKKANLCVGSHQIPAIAWTCIVGESGTGKSRAESLILAPLKAWQKAEYDRFKPEWNKYKSSLNKKTEASSANQPPLPERKFLFGIATIQAVMRRLSEQGQNGSLWARDEIAGLFKSFGQFTAKGESEGLECLLAMWDGAPAPVDRVQQDDSYLVDSTRLSLAGGLQPGVFRKIFSDPDDAQGIQARFLFALPKELPAKRVSGYCYLSDKLPQFYRWVDTQFPGGKIKLSPSADARYSQVYESIGRQVLAASTPAVRAWMRKLPGQLLRIALALHVIECYHEPLRPKLQLQLDTLDRAFEICRYYRSTFEVVQESVSDSDCVSSILLKIWDMAATSPQGLAVRDAYRSIKALARRAKEQGRSVAAYTTDLYYQLEKMGRGSVQKVGRLVRFVAGVTNNPDAPKNCDAEGGTLSCDDRIEAPLSQDDTSLATQVSDEQMVDTLGFELSPQELVSPVTQQIEFTQNNTLSNKNNDGSDLELESGDVTRSHHDTVSDRPVVSASINCDRSNQMASKNLLSDQELLLSECDLQSWLNRIASVQSADECIDCIDALNSLPSDVNELILSLAETLLPRFWEILERGLTQPESGLCSKVSQQQEPNQNCDRNPPTQGYLKSAKQNATDYVKNLITGLWVRTTDGFYGHLGAMVSDGRWWVKSPKSKTRDAESRLYAAADIIPMPI